MAAGARSPLLSEVLGGQLRVCIRGWGAGKLDGAMTDQYVLSVFKKCNRRSTMLSFYGGGCCQALSMVNPAIAAACTAGYVHTITLDLD